MTWLVLSFIGGVAVGAFAMLVWLYHLHGNKH